MTKDAGLAASNGSSGRLGTQEAAEGMDWKRVLFDVTSLLQSIDLSMELDRQTISKLTKLEQRARHMGFVGTKRNAP